MAVTAGSRLSISLLLYSAVLITCTATKLGDVWPMETNVELDSPIELYCSLNPEHADVIANGWNSSNLAFFRPNGSFIPITDGSVSAVNSTTIKFSRTTSTAEDSGDYHCNLKRSDGTSRNVGSGQIFVGTVPKQPDTVRCISYDLQSLKCTWVPPKNAVKTNYSIFFRLNSRRLVARRFGCPSGNHSKNTCTWKIDSEPPYIRRPLLHFGFDAYNKLGNETFERVYNFKNYENFKPAPVNNLTIVSVDSETSFDVTWGLSYMMQYTDVHLNHSVRWRPVVCGDTGKWNEVVLQLTHGTKHHYRLKDLPFANERYEIAVQAVPAGAAFDDLWSDPAVVFARSSPLLPRTPIMDDSSFEVVMSSADSERTIFVYWVKPDPCYHNGANLRQKVELLQEGEIVKHVEVDSSKSFAEFGGMRTDMGYTVRVTAVNDVGPSPDSAEIRIRPQRLSPQVPYSVSSILFAAGVYEVSWKPPKSVPSSPEITSYTVFYCEHESPIPNRCDGKIGWVEVPASTTRYNLTNLDPRTSYQFAVAVNSKSGSSGLFWATCTVEYNRIKRPLRHVWVTTETTDAISLGWRHECQSSFGLISASNIRYCKVNSCDGLCVSEQRVVRIVGDWENGTVRGLDPYSMYKFTVGVESRAGESPPNDPPVCGSTDQGAPSGPPTGVTVVDINDNSAELNWFPPRAELLNGIVHSSKIWVNNKPVVLHSNTTTWRVHELESYMNYSFSVQTCTRNGELCSPKSEDVFARTKISEPGQTSAPRGRFLNSTSILVFWDPPEEPNGPLAFYEVNVTVVSSSGVVKSFTTNQSDVDVLQAEVAVPECNPDVDLQYTVNIRAVNVKEDGKLLPGPWSTVGSVTCGETWDRGALVGIIAGCSLLAVVFAGLAWVFGRKVKAKWVEITTIDVKMPEKFDFGYANALHQRNSTGEDFPKPRQAMYLRMDLSRESSEDGGSERDRNWSGSTEDCKLEKTALWQDMPHARKALSPPDDAISGCSLTHGSTSEETASTGSRRSHHASSASTDSGTDTKLADYDFSPTSSSGYAKILWPIGNTKGGGDAELRKRTPSPVGTDPQQTRVGVQDYVTVGLGGQSPARPTPNTLHVGYCQLGNDSSYVGFDPDVDAAAAIDPGYVTVGVDRNAAAAVDDDDLSANYVREGVRPPRKGFCADDGRGDDDDDDHDEDANAFVSKILGAGKLGDDVAFDDDDVDIDLGDVDADSDSALDLGILDLDARSANKNEVPQPRMRAVANMDYVLPN